MLFKLLELVGEVFVLYLLYKGVVQPFFLKKKQAPPSNNYQNAPPPQGKSNKKGKQDGDYIDYEEVK
ncbi:MAG: hypothetical protein RLZZ292_497 [Bacteroidota bacterium]|jgi:hypothetical protein